jgi:hypothetical protein
MVKVTGAANTDGFALELTDTVTPETVLTGCAGRGLNAAERAKAATGTMSL